MRRIILFAFLFTTYTNSYGQNIGINSTGATPDASAILDLNTGNTGTKGFLPEHVALTATNAASPITSPATGLVVYNTATAGTSPTNVVPGYYYWNNSSWVYFITNSKISLPTPGLLLGSTTANVLYNPGYNIVKKFGSGIFDYNTYSSPTVVTPTSLDYFAAYESDNNYVITSAGSFSKVCGWINGSVATKTVTVYVYLYTPFNNSAANISGTLIGSQTITISTANANYYYEITGNTAIAKGQFIRVWFQPNSNMQLFSIGTVECTYIPQ